MFLTLAAVLGSLLLLTNFCRALRRYRALPQCPSCKRRGTPIVLNGPWAAEWATPPNRYNLEDCAPFCRHCGLFLQREWLRPGTAPSLPFSLR